MRIKYVLLPLLLVAVGASACEQGKSKGEALVAASEPAAEASEEKPAGADIDALVQECAECHSGRLGFSGESPENLAKAIASLAGGDEHEGIPDLSPEDLAALAQALTGL